ncbi:Glycosyl transferase family 2 [Flavobacterium sp. 9AF]|uniref:glycosyltransferase family 2 protein n=1 Tax=Flavobacterium sp. 9AF TaxID=2653142 RepID=UPI0012F0984D|nr:glycosyltransferase family 2 protein [Flavobacterium sp. 9AF]VXC24402.1 Glycosyl transferase family 2 [Flavobacterium sp. 9AF]
MQLSVIILNYNVRYFLEQCIYSVQKALANLNPVYSGEIIVVDNNSTDGSCEMVKSLFPEIVLIENKENLGFPKGNNIGVANAKGEYICILNPDTVVSEDTFLKLFDKKWNEKTGIVGCKLVDGTGYFLPESKRGTPTPWVSFTKIFGLYHFFPKWHWFNKYYAQHLKEDESGEVDILVGAFMFMKKALYLNVGGFDENCFMYSDDIDLSYMVLKKGFQNLYFPYTVVIHYKGESTVRDSNYFKRFSEAMQFFYKKHFKKSFLFDVMMRLGSVIFTVFKMKQQKSKERIIDSFIVFSKTVINLNVSQPISYLASFEFFKNTSQKNIEIIFNTDDFSYGEIINFMQLNKCKNITYKNYIPQSKYLIGSNSSNDRGKVILL